MANFNKMTIMIPVMMAARKLDAEDVRIVHMVRVAYATVMFLCLLLVVYAYIQARSAVSHSIPPHTLIYLPAVALPFGVDANAPKKKYTQTLYASHVTLMTRNLVGSTLLGIAITVGLHYYKAMLMGLAIQTVMAPLNLFENAVLKALFFGKGSIRVQDRIFGEKLAADLTDATDIVVDENGAVLNIIELQQQQQQRAIQNNSNDSSSRSSNKTNNKASSQNNANASSSLDGQGSCSSATSLSLEIVLLDTWDQGNKADLGPLMQLLNRSNVNYQTEEHHWTPIMILSGLGSKGSVSAIRSLREMGADLALTDIEGWTALHWAAFHGCLNSAQELCTDTSLLAVRDKEGNTPIETARKEGNEDVAALFEKALGENKKSK